MSGIEIEPAEQVKLLEEFIFNNQELEGLEAIVDKFNIFSSLRIIDQEIKHSNFLGWLLDPNETHNLGEYFITAFLKMATRESDAEYRELGIIDIDTLDLSNMQVLREWNNIDLVLVDENQKLVVALENKVSSSEHSNQLTRYKETIQNHYPNFRKLFILLTVQGVEAVEEKMYVPLSYLDISELILRILNRKGSQLNDEIVTFITHYNEMIKRYIMEESEVQVLCEKIYKKHKRALDLIFKHKPDVYLTVKDALVEILSSNDKLILDHSSKGYIRFIPVSFDFLPKEGTDWTKSGRLFMFEIQNVEKSVDLALMIGPGNSSTRQKIYDQIKDKTPFKKSKLYEKWTTVYKRKLSQINKLEDKSKDEIQEILLDQLSKFFRGDFEKLEKEVLKLR